MVAASLLPEIVNLLRVGRAPGFVVLRYAGFVNFAAAAGDVQAPDVAAVLDCRANHKAEHEAEHEFAVLRVAAYRQFLSRAHLTGEVDEAHYRDRHPDVAAAITQGRVASATRHYLVQGYFERRAVRFPAQPGGSYGTDSG
jgi:hypothetical protein